MRTTGQRGQLESGSAFRVSSSALGLSNLGQAYDLWGLKFLIYKMGKLCFLTF